MNTISCSLYNISQQIDIVEKYCKENNLWYSSDQPDPEYTEKVEINLSELEPNLAGPKRPHDLIPLSDMKKEFNKAITAPIGNQGFGLEDAEIYKEISVEHPNDETSVIDRKSVV